MTRGKSWSKEEETLLKDLLKTETSMGTIASKLHRTPEAIYVKCIRLGITDQPKPIKPKLPLPRGLPSVEDALKKLATAMETASTPGLDRVEVQRLQTLATLAKTYKEILADYINYRDIEAKLNDMEEKYATLRTQKKRPQTQSNATPQNPQQMEQNTTTA